MTAKAIGKTATYEQLIPFHDCDMLKIVWHGNYFKYLECARSELMRIHKIGVSDLMELGMHQYVIDAQCRYSFPLRFGDKIKVTARFLDIELRLRVGYEIHNLTHEKRAARAWTALITADAEGNMLMQTPSSIIERIENA